ncbi:MAG: hypothetical protein RLN81_10505 [Balneolaceae bacterium]
MKTQILSLVLFLAFTSAFSIKSTAQTQTLNYSINNYYVLFLVNNYINSDLYNLDFQVQVANGQYSSLNSFTVTPTTQGTPINVSYSSFWIERYSNNQMLTWEVMFTLTTTSGSTFYEYRTGNISYQEYINNTSNEGPGGPIGPGN